MIHSLIKPKRGEVDAKQATCTCGLVITGISRNDASGTIRRHAARQNAAA
jgi:hypothetical protein